MTSSDLTSRIAADSGATGTGETPVSQQASSGMPVVESLGGREASAEYVERVPIHFARQHGLLGLAGENGKLPVAVSDSKVADAWDALQVVSRFLGRPVQPLVAPAAQVSAAINDAYERRTGQAQTFVQSIEPAHDDGDALRHHADEWQQLRAGRDD